MLVSMKLSEKFQVPRDAALLYDFVNSLDMRRYVEQGAAHDPSDELNTPEQMEVWLRARGLLKRGARVPPAEHREALALRHALRTFLAAAPADRFAAAGPLAASAGRFPLEVFASGEAFKSGAKPLDLRPLPGRTTSGLGHVLSELIRLSDGGRLERVKTCDSEECRWVFYDQSKPSNRRWCSSDRCGNRAKTRTYRKRHGTAAA
jgi:predicted RNA-binding Zn ribbon-like protein